MVKKYPLLDIFRLLCACLVVLIHMGTDESTPAARMMVTCFARQAVPFFFMVSGFFFCRKLEQTADKKGYLFRYVSRMLVFYGLWALISLPQILRTYSGLYKDVDGIYFAALLARRFLLAGFGPFWYLLALAETAAIAGILLIKGKERWLYILAAAGISLYAVYSAEPPGAVFEICHKVIYLVFSWNCNFLMSGIPFFSVGVWFARNPEKANVPLKPLILLYALVGAAGMGGYGILVSREINPERYLFFFLAQAVLLFLIGINAKPDCVGLHRSEWLRSCSSAIYCLHTLVIEYFLGEIMPWSVYFAVNYFAVIAVCCLVYGAVRFLKIKPLYSLICLK